MMHHEDTVLPRERTDREAGFTLLELLVVLAIMGLLAAIIAPQVLKYLGSSRSQAAKVRTKSQYRKLRYNSALDDNREIPAWLDWALRKAVHPAPEKRYEALSEFVFDLRQPNMNYLSASPTPLIQRNPLLFWKGLCFILACLVLFLLARLHGAH